MKAILLATATALLAGTTPASGGVLTLGSTYAESCYRSAEARVSNFRTMDECNNALTVEALPRADVVGTHVNRGILYMIAGDLARANLDFDAALRLENDTAEAWLNKGIAQLKMGNSPEALKLAQKSLDLNVRDAALAYFVRGLAHEDAGNLSDAYADLVRARELAPKWHEPKLELARYRVRR